MGTEPTQECVDSLHGELREEKEVVAALEESKADCERLLSKKIDELCEARAKCNQLHKALAEGNGVEDGGIWEDRAVAAEAELINARNCWEQEVRERLEVTTKSLRGEASAYRRREAECKRDEEDDHASGKLKPEHGYEATWNYYQGLWNAYDHSADELRRLANFIFGEAEPIERKGDD